MLLTQTKNRCSYPILGNGISSFRHSNGNNGDRHQQEHLSGSSFFTDPNYLQNQGSRSDTIIETETKRPPKSSDISSNPALFFEIDLNPLVYILLR